MEKLGISSQDKDAEIRKYSSLLSDRLNAYSRQSTNRGEEGRSLISKTPWEIVLDRSF